MPQQIFINPLEQERPKRMKAYAIMAGMAAVWLLLMFGNQYLRNFQQGSEPLNQTRTVMVETSAASVQTRRAEFMESTAVSLTQAIEATASYELAMNLTATLGSGTLPCHAYSKDDSLRFYWNIENYAEDLDWFVMEGEQDYRLVEWFKLNNITWYRANPDGWVAWGYIQADELILDADCPR